MPVNFSGPFFTPGIDAIVDTELATTRHKISAAAEMRVRGLLHDFIRMPSRPPHYENRVMTDLSFADRDRVYVSNVVYDTWIEGTSSRNQSTRFKGYHVFRIVTQGMQQRAVDLGNQDADRIVRVLNG